MGKQWEQFSGRGKGGLCGGLITLGTHACELLFPHLGFVSYHERCSKNSLLPTVCRFAWITFPTPTVLRVIPAIPRTLINVMPACLSYPPPQCFHFGYHYRIEHPAAKTFSPRHHFFLSPRAISIQARAWRPHHRDLLPRPAAETAEEEEEEEEEAPASDSPGLAGERRARRRPWRSPTPPGRRRQSPGVGRWRRLPKVVVVWSGVASGCSFHFHFPPILSCCGPCVHASLLPCGVCFR